MRRLAVLAETLTVIAGDRHDRAIEQAARDPLKQSRDLGVRVADFPPVVRRLT